MPLLFQSLSHLHPLPHSPTCTPPSLSHLHPSLTPTCTPPSLRFMYPCHGKSYVAYEHNTMAETSGAVKMKVRGGGYHTWSHTTPPPSPCLPHLLAGKFTSYIHVDIDMCHVNPPPPPHSHYTTSSSPGSRCPGDV